MRNDAKNANRFSEESTRREGGGGGGGGGGSGSGGGERNSADSGEEESNSDAGESNGGGGGERNGDGKRNGDDEETEGKEWYVSFHFDEMPFFCIARSLIMEIWLLCYVPTENKKAKNVAAAEEEAAKQGN